MSLLKSNNLNELVIEKMIFYHLNMDKAIMHAFIAYPGNHPEVMKAALTARSSYIEQDHLNPTLESIHFIWKPTNFSPSYYSSIDTENSRRLPDNEIVLNHLENMRGITTKNGLINSLKKYYICNNASAALSYHVFLTTPTTFLCKPLRDNSVYIAFAQRFKEIGYKNFTKESLPSKHCEQNIWIVKPSFLNQGRGIEVFHNLLDIQQFLADKNPHSTWIIQKYIERPLLYYERKFDIRVWALVTHTGELYYYKEGYLRTSSDLFNLDMNEKWIHLTNNCFQCNGEKYGKYEEGNTLSFYSFKEYLAKQFPQYNIDFHKHIEARIVDIIIDTYISIKNECHPKGRKRCFELLGYDFMVDEDFRTWLIEVNENPYIGIPNEFIRNMLPRMLNNMFRIVLDPYLKPKEDPFASEAENLWELLYSEKVVDKKVIVIENKRRPFTIDVYPILELKPPKNDKDPGKHVSTYHSQSIVKRRRNIMSKNLESLSFDKCENKTTKPELSKDDIVCIARDNLKRLQDMADSVISHFKEHKFISLCKKINERLMNYTLFTEAEIGECLIALTRLYHKLPKVFFHSIYVKEVITKYLNLNNVGTDCLHDTVISLASLMSKDCILKKHLYDDQIFNAITSSLLSTCENDKDNKNYVELAKILWALGSFNRHILSARNDTLEVNWQKRMFIDSGSLLLLFHLKKYCKIKEVTDYVILKLKDMDIAAYELQLNILQVRTQSLNSTTQAFNNNEHPGNTEHNYAIYKSINIKAISSVIKEEYEICKDSSEKKAEELNRIKQASKDLKKRKSEEDRKKKEDETEKAYQLMFQRYELLKKKKIESIKHDIESKEAYIKAQDGKRKEQMAIKFQENSKKHKNKKIRNKKMSTLNATHGIFKRRSHSNKGNKIIAMASIDEPHIKKKYAVQRKITISNESQSQIFNIYSGASIHFRREHSEMPNSNVFIIHI